MLLWFTKGLIAGGVRLEKIRAAVDIALLIASERSGTPFSDGLESNLLQYGVLDSKLYLSSSGPHATHVSWIDKGEKIRASSGGLVRPTRLEAALNSVEESKVDIVSKATGLVVVGRYDSFFVKSLTSFGPPQFTAWDEFRRIIRGAKDRPVGISAKSLLALLTTAATRLRSFDVGFGSRLAIGKKGDAYVAGPKLRGDHKPFYVDGQTLLSLIETMGNPSIRVMRGLPILLLERGPHSVYMRGRPCAYAQNFHSFVSPPKKTCLPVREGKLPDLSVSVTKSGTVIHGCGASIVSPGGTNNGMFTFHKEAAQLALESMGGKSIPAQIRFTPSIPYMPRPTVATSQKICEEFPLERMLAVLVFMGHLSHDPIEFHREDGYLVIRTVGQSLNAACRISTATPFRSFAVKPKSARWLYGVLKASGNSYISLSNGQARFEINGSKAFVDVELLDGPIPQSLERHGSKFEAKIGVRETKSALSRVMRKARQESGKSDLIKFSVIHDKLNGVDFVCVTAPTPARNYARIPATIISGRKPKPVAVPENAVRLALGAIQGRCRNAADIQFHSDGITVVRHLKDWAVKIWIASE